MKLTELLIKNIVLISDSVRDPNGLAQEAYRAGLMPLQKMVMLTSDSTIDDKTKTMKIFRHVVDEVSDQPHLSHHLLTMLQNHPELNYLLTKLQTSGKLIVMVANYINP